jgi:transcriptional regulator with XRE-family HTH domain
VARTRLTALIDRYKNAHGVSDAELARRIGISQENLRLWRANGLRALPDQHNLRAVARTIAQPYRQVLSAALLDAGYLTDTDAGEPRPCDEVLHDAISASTKAAWPIRPNAARPGAATPGSRGQNPPPPRPRSAGLTRPPRRSPAARADRHTPTTTHPPTAVDMLTAILARDGAQLSASSAAASDTDPFARRHREAAMYADALTAGAEQHAGPAVIARIDAPAAALGAETATPTTTTTSPPARTYRAVRQGLSAPVRRRYALDRRRTQR